MSEQDDATRATRPRTLVVGAVAAGVLGILALILLRPGGPLDGTGPAGTGVPDQLYAVPEHMAAVDYDTRGFTSDEVDTDLAVGRSAAAWVMSGGLLVTVGAEDGDYHLVDGRLGRAALSPDGRLLLKMSLQEGLAIVDLDTGVVDYLRQPAGVRALREIAWSPDGRWVAWSGTGGAGRTPVATKVGELSPLTRTQWQGDISISDDGTVLVVGRNGVVRWDGDTVAATGPIDVRQELRAGAAVSPGGATLAVGSCCTSTAILVDAYTGTVEREVDVPFDGPLASAEPLGWLDERTSVWQVMPQGGGGDGHLLLVSLDGDVRVVGRVEDAVPDAGQIAVDLMTVATPTVERPAPHWPWSPVAITTAIGIALGLTAIGSSLALARRRARQGRPPTVPASPVVGVAGFVAGATGSFLGAFGWMWLVVAVLDPNADNGLVAILLGPALLVVGGVALLVHRYWRTTGVGLLVGPPAAVLTAFVIVMAAIGE